MASLTCDICFEEYGDNDKSEIAPKILSCGHTFCCKCIKETMKKNNNQIICSIDRINDNRPFDQIPYNRIIYDMILKEKEQKKKINIKPKENYDFMLNIGMIGSEYAGKTSLSKCFQNNEPFQEEDCYKPTLSLDYFNRIINMNGKNIYIRVWDTAGQEKFNSITSVYLRGLHGCFIVFDVTERDSFDNLDMWIQFYNDFNQYKQRIIIILGNKVDIKERKVTKKEANNYAIKKGLLYFETSAKTMQNVKEAFNEMAKIILKSQEENSFNRKNSKIKIVANEHKEEKPKKGAGGCC